MKILQYLPSTLSCSILGKSSHSEFEFEKVFNKQELITRTYSTHYHAIVFCYCYADESDITTILNLKSRLYPTTIIVSSKFANPEFIRTLAQKGLNNFILCNMADSKKRSIIKEAIRKNSIRIFIENELKPNEYSPYTNDIVSQIVKALPQQLHIDELAMKLGISTRWTQRVIKKIFGIPYTDIMRKIQVITALEFMQYTTLDNTEIAFKLGYNNGTSLYRIFQKELGFSPTMARKRLYKNKSMSFN